MTFFSYLESQYAQANLEVQQEFSLLKQAEANAAQKLIAYQRSVFTLYAYAKHLVGYLAVKVGLKQPPASPKAIFEAFAAKNAPKPEPASNEHANELE